MSSASVACHIDSPALRTIGHGSSRRIAEQVAAEQALKELLA
jgi:ribonuclease-3